MKRLGALLASLLLAGSLTACGGTAAQEMQSIQVFAMDTVMGLRACGGDPRGVGRLCRHLRRLSAVF